MDEVFNLFNLFNLIPEKVHFPKKVFQFDFSILDENLLINGSIPYEMNEQFFES